MSGPSALKVDAVQRRLVLISERVDDLRQLGEVTTERLAADWVVRAAVERVLTQLVELAAQANTHVVVACGRVPPTEYRQSFSAAAELGLITAELATKVQASAGLRNILVHQYLDIDLGIVASAVSEAIDDYSEYVRQVARWLTDRAGD
ncbi:MAG: DUF86 domain-containing protein [Actinomycetota bacterium]|nr:DUF86 domain-containing protein [Actinomycetota bacterium]